MAGILKKVAVAGAGLAVGLTSMAPPWQRTASRTALSEDDILDLEPVLDRLEALERRLEPAHRGSEAAEIPQVSTAHLEQRMEVRLRDLRAELPQLVEAGVEARIAAIEARIDAEMAAQRRETQASVVPLIRSELAKTVGPLIEAGIASQVGQRFEALEKAVAEQSEAIVALRERVEQTDLNLQRLITAIEKLVDGAPNAVDVPGPSPANASFQTHLAEAMEQGPAPAEVPVTGFRSRIFVEPEPKEARKPRFPLSRIFGFVMALGLGRFFS
jgi:hypothetical protein